MFLCEWWKRKKNRSTESNQNQLSSFDENFIDGSITADNYSAENNSNKNSKKSMFA